MKPLDIRTLTEIEIEMESRLFWVRRHKRAVLQDQDHASHKTSRKTSRKDQDHATRTT